MISIKNSKEKLVDLFLQEEALNMEPECDLLKHQAIVDKHKLQFSSYKELNFPWIKIKAGEDPQTYDDLMCISLEMNFWQYMNGGPDKDQYRFVQLLPDLIVDVHCMCEVNNKF